MEATVRGFVKEMIDGLNANTLQRIVHPSRSIVDAEAILLAKALETNESCYLIRLQDNKIGDEGAKALAKCLTTNKTIRVLDLGGNMIEKAGGIAFARALENNNTLTELILSFNRVSAEGAEAIAAALRFNTTLKTLGLTQNMIGNEGGLALAAVLQDDNFTLNEIRLENNNMNKEAGAALAKAVHDNKNITFMSVRKNFFAYGVEWDIIRTSQISNHEACQKVLTQVAKAAESSPEIDPQDKEETKNIIEDVKKTVEINFNKNLEMQKVGMPPPDETPEQETEKLLADMAKKNKKQTQQIEFISKQFKMQKAADEAKHAKAAEELAQLKKELEQERKEREQENKEREEKDRAYRESMDQKMAELKALLLARL